jgi:hypothetical protein
MWHLQIAYKCLRNRVEVSMTMRTSVTKSCINYSKTLADESSQVKLLQSRRLKLSDCELTNILFVNRTTSSHLLKTANRCQKVPCPRAMCSRSFEGAKLAVSRTSSPRRGSDVRPPWSCYLMRAIRHFRSGCYNKDSQPSGENTSNGCID